VSNDLVAKRKKGKSDRMAYRAGNQQYRVQDGMEQNVAPRIKGGKKKNLGKLSESEIAKKRVSLSSWRHEGEKDKREKKKSKIVESGKKTGHKYGPRTERKRHNICGDREDKGKGGPCLSDTENKRKEIRRQATVYRN